MSYRAWRRIGYAIAAACLGYTALCVRNAVAPGVPTWARVLFGVFAAVGPVLVAATVWEIRKTEPWS